jgi:hypothetical protein
VTDSDAPEIKRVPVTYNGEIVGEATVYPDGRVEIVPGDNFPLHWFQEGYYSID